MKYSTSLGIACLALFLSALLAFPMRSEAKASKKPIKLLHDFTGNLPSSTDNGDLFGYTLGINDKFFIVGSPGASPSGAQNAGAIYFIHKNVLGEWEEVQTPFFIPTQDNQISFRRLITREDWLFVPLPGTPSDNTTKNNAGSVLVFRKNDNTWDLVQTIQNPQPVNDNQFGTFLDYCGGHWLVVGAIDSNYVYFYKLNKETYQWELAQTITLPTQGYAFVCMNERHAFISSARSEFPSTQNGLVYAYHLKDGVWEYKQTLEGSSPLSVTYNCGDSFGSYMQIYRNWAVIGAPTDNVMSDLAGAAYFFHYSDKEKGWVMKQKVYSDWPTAFFGSTVSIEHDLALIADPCKTIIADGDERHVFQGAVNVYKRHPVCWDVGVKVWSWVETLTDPNGSAYDFLGGTGSDIHDHYVGIGTAPTLDSKLPNGFPGKRTLPYNPPPSNGKALLFEVRH